MRCSVQEAVKLGGAEFEGILLYAKADKIVKQQLEMERARRG